MKEAVWLRRFEGEIIPGKKQDLLPRPGGASSVDTSPLVIIFCDNQPAVKLSRNPEFHRRTKHFDVEVHYIRERQDEGAVKVEDIDSDNQLADIFTKPLTHDKFAAFRRRIGMGTFGNTGMKG